MTIDRTIISLAILKVNWDKKKEDYIENFVPFIATLINNKKYTEITSEFITKDFNEEFGIDIPSEPIITVLSRCVKRGIIKRNGKAAYIPIWDVIAKYEFTDRQLEQERRQNKIITEIEKFVYEKFNDSLTKEEIQNIIIEYFRHHDVDILFAAYKRTLLPDVTVDKKKKYYIYKFIVNCSEKDPEVFNFIVDLAIGHVLANTIMYRDDYRNYQGKLLNLVVYLDIQFLLRLSGVEGELKRGTILQFIEGIFVKGGNVKVFQHTHDEALGILKGAKAWINKKNYDKSRANIATQYFIENSKTESDVDLCISQLQTLLLNKRIGIEVAPDRNDLKKYLISEQELNDKIIKIYKEGNPNFKEDGKENTIYKDITSISSIYILRKNEKPINIKHAGYIFVTTNSALALAARRFEQDNYSNNYIIPACITQVLLGTDIWLDNPVQLLKFNQMKMIADCMAALNPSRELTKHYLNEVEKMHENGRITDDQYYYMKADKFVYELLEEKTLGDEENFDEKTAEEILNETINKEKIESSAKLEHQIQVDELKLNLEKIAHLHTQRELQSEAAKLNKLISQNECIAKKISDTSAVIVYCIMYGLVILGVLSAPPFEYFSGQFRVVFMILASIIGIVHLIYGFDIRKMKNILKMKIYSTVLKSLQGK